MARRVFYSFHYKPDNWGTAQVRNIGSIDGNRPTTDNDWETIKQSGDSTIKQVDCQPDETRVVDKGIAGESLLPWLSAVESVMGRG